jgi:hypothetical protein
VPVDPLGLCPEGHLLPAQGRRVESAIGSDDHHPDEPEPWIAQVDPPAESAAEQVVPSAEPQAAPGLAPAERETSTGDLLRELGSLHASDEPPPSAPGGTGPSAPSAAAVPSDVPSAAPSPAPSTTPPLASPGPDVAVSEHSALEQALQSLEDSHQVPDAPVTTEPAAPTPTPDDDISSLFAELEGIDTSPAPNGSTPAASTAPHTPPPAASQPPTAPPQASPSQPTAPPPAQQPRPTRRSLREAGELAGAASESPASPPAHGDNGHGDNGHGSNGHGDDERDTSAAARGLDTMNFTAKGGAMNGRRRRRLLGR